MKSGPVPLELVDESDILRDRDLGDEAALDVGGDVEADVAADVGRQSRQEEAADRISVIRVIRRFVQNSTLTSRSRGHCLQDRF